jgi:hypothetical protein
VKILDRKVLWKKSQYALSENIETTPAHLSESNHSNVIMMRKEVILPTPEGKINNITRLWSVMRRIQHYLKLLFLTL